MSFDPDNDTSETPGAGCTALSPEAECSLALEAQLGNRAALDELVLSHHARVSSILWKFTCSPHDLADLVQDTFLRMLRGLPAWRPHQPFAHWVSRIAVNTGRDYCRRGAVRGRWMVEPHRGDANDPDSAPAIEAIEPEADPAARAAANEVKDLLARLSPDDQTLLTLFHLEGWDLKTIAQHLGWTHTATKLRAWRARQRLRSLLENPSAP